MGARRNPLRRPEDAAALARAARALPGVEVARLLAYEAHIAGLPDWIPGAPHRSAALRLMKRAAAPAALALRAETVARATVPPRAPRRYPSGVRSNATFTADHTMRIAAASPSTSSWKTRPPSAAAGRASSSASASAASCASSMRGCQRP